MKKLNATALKTLIEECCLEDAYQLDGYVWTSRPQELLSAKLQISVATLRRYISKPPFVRKSRHVNGKLTTLLRVGEPGPETDYDIAQKMSAIWRKKTSKKNTPKEFGCLIGLAQNWPKGHQIELFKICLNEWQDFMSAVDYWIQTQEPDVDAVYKHYYKYPSITVMRRFHLAAMELAEMNAQSSGGPIKQYIKDYNPGLYVYNPKSKIF
jgi:hypothetical protein